MASVELFTDIGDAAVLRRAVQRCRERQIVLPTFAELADPRRVAPRIRRLLSEVDPDSAHPLNMFRVNWFNGADRRAWVPVPEHVVLPQSLTGVAAPIVVALGNRFPMIAAHKVLAAYACLAPRLVTGHFDPEEQRAVWPSTGNFCRGGIAISRIMACRGSAVLPEGMSAERFLWLKRWVSDPDDVVRTPGSESNVKEIYDRCRELARDPRNVICNQFAEYGNHLVHYACTGDALDTIFTELRGGRPTLRLRAFVSATGSAGTIAAGDRLKELHGSSTVAVEALECPTMLYNGFGAHNIQGIGDKHIPLIHNVMGTDIVVAVSDRATDGLLALFNTDAGRAFLAARRDIPAAVLGHLDDFGISSICNIVAAIKVARYLDLGPDDALFTVATDGAAMYLSERDKIVARDLGAGVDAAAASGLFGRYILGASADHLRELDELERQRIFNLGYFTWVEQQNVPLATFEARRKPGFWTELRRALPVWDQHIERFNVQTGVAKDS